MATSEVLKAIAVTAELNGRAFSSAAAMMFATDLDGFPEHAVLTALARCRKEVKGMPSIQDVISRIDDGRPAAEQAWAMLPTDEAGSVVWTEEMAQAFGAAKPLIDQGDRIGARMAFKEVYTKAVTLARDSATPAKWTPSFGEDRYGREAAMIEAVRMQRVTVDHAVLALGAEAGENVVRLLSIKDHPLLAAPSQAGRAQVKALLATVKAIGHE